MKFIDELDLELVNQTLNFETSETKITGGCDIFTTKPVASDKKLYKSIDRHLDSLLRENESYNLAVEQQMSLESQRRINDQQQQQQQHQTHNLYSLDSETVDDGSPSNSNSISFWEQKRRMSVGDSPQPSTPVFKSHKLNDQNLKDLMMNTPAENNGYLSSSSMESSQVNRLRRTSSASSLQGNENSSGVRKRRTSSIGSNANGGSGVPVMRKHSISKETINIGPFGPINETGSRRTFAYLIAILNASYPDHEFNSLEPTDFVRSSMKQLVSKFENSIIALGKQPQEWIWETINAHMDLGDCVFYQYNPQRSFLDDEPGHLWSLLWFMFNKKRKRVAFFYLSAFRLKNAPSAGNSITIDEDYESTTKGQYANSQQQRFTIEHNTNEFEGEYDLTYNSSSESAVQDEGVEMVDVD
ncbi:HCL350Wp [Eremothecium sinecaudum]|uniref:HCL350Wp n=1 Tax=Eremothecium sinecaudum TaxID=45286 RepID=A0A120K1X5_9SACH|nr:HCL350Wp [Eremothecium sinecaudum]AMD19801.1 HCL350Wp [Eremothecium sinecaudum]